MTKKIVTKDKERIKAELKKMLEKEDDAEYTIIMDDDEFHVMIRDKIFNDIFGDVKE